MTNPLHHTIRNRTSAKLLLCRQWVERINYEYGVLRKSLIIAEKANDGAAQMRIGAELNLWLQRLHNDIALAEHRLTEDGFEQVEQGVIGLSEDGDNYEFTPRLLESGEGAHPLYYNVWKRKAVQP